MSSSPKICIFAVLLAMLALSACKKETDCPKDGVACDDGVVCTVDDKYTDCKCAGTPATEFYNDGNPCTRQVCDPQTGELTTINLPAGTPCPDGTCDGNGSCNKLIDPHKFLPTMTFGTNGGTNLRGNERSFPVRFDFNTTQDPNNDGEYNAEDNLENYVEKSIGENISGTGLSGVAGRGPNDQRPVVYFHYTEIMHYGVYEYWYYFPDHYFASFDYGNHEHDWEMFFVYVPLEGGFTPSVKLSNNGQLVSYSMSSLEMDLRVPILGVQAGIHDFGPTPQGGVKIRFDGSISKNGGELNAGDGQVIPWTIFTLSNENSSHPNSPVVNTTSFTTDVTEFFEGDPEFPTTIPIYPQDEYGDGVNAPWSRPEWNSPPSP